MFFRDGLRRIDFVLSYVDDKDKDEAKKQVREIMSFFPFCDITIKNWFLQDVLSVSQ